MVVADSFITVGVCRLLGAHFQQYNQLYVTSVSNVGLWLFAPLNVSI